MVDDERWSEDDSDVYTSIAPIAVPDRHEQMAALTTLMPFGAGDEFRIVELASGEGELAALLSRSFPRATICALDGSERMRARTLAALTEFGDRAEVGPFDIQESDWFDMLDGAGVIVSSLCVHHLDAGGKKRLFAEAARRLLPGGALLLADLVLPQRPEARELFASSWDASAESQARSLEMGHLYERFTELQWNYFRFPDPFDKPSPLADQLRWLTEAGFVDVDCFWLRAGHAIYGGYLPEP